MPSFAIGVDLGGTNLRVAAVEDSGTPLEVLDAPTELHHGRDYVLSQMAGRIRRLTRKFAGHYHLLGVGVGVPGIIDLDSGIVHSAANLPGWEGFPIRNELELKLGLPVVLENDANCAALGEKWVGAGKDVEDLCMLTLGTGVGGGFVVNGSPWHGAMGMAGELGHMTVIPDGVPCPCGSRGCLELYASATAIRRMASRAIAQGKSSALAKLAERDPQFTARSVFEVALHGDPAAQAIFETMGSALGIALANLINALNLPLYVIGGGGAAAWVAFAPALFRELERRSVVFRAGEPMRSKHRGTTITPTALKESAGLLGAARLPMLMKKPPTCWSVAG
ncbi:MAG TPA: ROK family protein [Terriglobales bacterium]